MGFPLRAPGSKPKPKPSSSAESKPGQDGARRSGRKLALLLAQKTHGSPGRTDKPVKGLHAGRRSSGFGGRR